ncbi:hypothetical protein [Pseudodonghicola xiamenensis]|uniref:Uncharacterized protein n=1 Tax=Pseudodonghicola xiamenensis TaxID=337702 RepID=A0A8J3HBD8_9RHOB|nr:hypothetical protein [Pseudodonghicola xiamenensis]GHH00093.1 hypothetical protein GCM10010961_36590 [Pseudodonghicola xiamenensis]
MTRDHRETRIFVRTINLATGVQEGEEIMDHDNDHHRATLEQRLHWAVRNGRALTIGPTKLPD